MLDRHRKFPQDRRVQRVQCVRAVDGDDGEAVFHLRLDEARHDCLLPPRNDRNEDERSPARTGKLIGPALTAGGKVDGCIGLPARWWLPSPCYWLRRSQSFPGPRGPTWTDSTVVWTSSTNATATTWAHATLATTFEVKSDATITVPAGTFTTTPIKETNTANATYTMNYWSAQVGNWVRVGDYDSTGRNTDNFNLTSSNYQGGNFFTSIIFGLPVWIWLILLVVILVAIIGVFAVRRRRPPTRAMPPSPPPMPPQEPMGPEGPPPP